MGGMKEKNTDHESHGSDESTRTRPISSVFIRTDSCDPCYSWSVFYGPAAFKSSMGLGRLHVLFGDAHGVDGAPHEVQADQQQRHAGVGREVEARLVRRIR